ncbi:MAG: exo-alpha-sialidase [Gemmatimonadaceae bacterium]|nr:exo-alpha-sialidase [Chitinophagaceae bacterium]
MKYVKSFRSTTTVYLAMFLLLIACNPPSKFKSENVVVGSGQMPAAVTDSSGNLHLVFGHGDSILYANAQPDGDRISTPILVSIVPELAASHMRGPQIAATRKGIAIIACDNNGNIFSFHKTDKGQWQQGARVNDADTVAKEGLLAISGDGDNLFAVWLDLRDKHNKIFGSQSSDNGLTWSKNLLIYASPDSTVCECCKPSVIVKKNKVIVMFRNWLSGNRDMYITESDDGGKTFAAPAKLGTESWAVDGCPMDGGSMAVINDKLHTVWYRKGKIFSYMPGKTERELAEGKGCAMTVVHNRPAYAWTEKGSIIVDGEDGKINIAKGKAPVLTGFGPGHLTCIWENDKTIMAKIFPYRID